MHEIAMTQENNAMWTMDNTDGFTQDQLDEINALHEKLMAEYDGDYPEQFAHSLNDAINNEWGADDLEAAVRKRLHLG